MYTSLLPVFALMGFVNKTPVSNWQAGNLVRCNWQGGGTMYNGMVLARMGERLLVGYTDGDVETLSATMCEYVGPPPHGNNLGSLGGMSVGTRVSCDWQGEGPKYIGKIDLIVNDRIRILYDGGDEELTAPARCRAVTVDNDGFTGGERVECNWNDQGTYYPALIQTREGRTLNVLYDDGYTEQTTIGKCRTR